jgi:hypothetical protein
VSGSTSWNSVAPEARLIGTPSRSTVSPRRSKLELRPEPRIEMRLSRCALVSANTPGVSSSTSPIDWAKMSAKPSSSTRPVAPGTRSSALRACSAEGAVGEPGFAAVTMISSCRWPMPCA